MTIINRVSLLLPAALIIAGPVFAKAPRSTPVPEGQNAGACLVRDLATSAPYFGDHSSGPGYVKLDMGSAGLTAEDLQLFCTPEVFARLMSRFCDGAGDSNSKKNRFAPRGPVQWQVEVYQASGAPYTTECAMASGLGNECGYHYCP